MGTDKPENGRATPNEHFADDSEEYIRDLEELHRDFLELEERVDHLLEPQLRKIAGPHLERMLQSPEETIKYLANASPKLRQAAVQLAYQKWNITGMLASNYESMALSDPDFGVRNAAIGALGTCYRKTKDRRIGHLLATMVRNEDLSELMRITAFASLLRLHGNMEYTGTGPLVPRSLSEIDWDFVDHYYEQGSLPPTP
jgi:hypothetical protein